MRVECGLDRDLIQLVFDTYRFLAICSSPPKEIQMPHSLTQQLDPVKGGRSSSWWVKAAWSID